MIWRVRGHSKAHEGIEKRLAGLEMELKAARLGTNQPNSPPDRTQSAFKVSDRFINWWRHPSRPSFLWNCLVGLCWILHETRSASRRCRCYIYIHTYALNIAHLVSSAALCRGRVSNAAGDTNISPTYQVLAPRHGIISHRGICAKHLC
jgi:hypothetical protein